MILQVGRCTLLRCLVLLACSLPFCAVDVAARQANQAPGWPSSKTSKLATKFQEQPVGKIPRGSELGDLQAASGHVAWTEDKASTSKSIVLRDGKQVGGKYDGVKFLEFSSDGTHLAFFGERDSRWLLVLDQREYSPEYSDVTPVFFQPNGSSWAFGSCVAEGNCHVILDGEPTGKVSDQMTPLDYSPDGKRLAYLVQSKNKWTAFIDGEEIGPQLDDISCLGFSPQDLHFFVCGQIKKKGLTYFVDGAPGPYFVQLSPISFSTDDKHYAYGGSGMQFGFKQDATAGTIVVDGKAGQTYEGGGLPGEWMLLLNAPLIAAAVYSGGVFIPSSLFVPGHLLPGSQVLSARLNGVSNPVLDDNNSALYAARRGKNDIVVMNGAQPGPRFDDVVSQVVLTKDGAHSAYVALRGRDLISVLDNQPGKAIPLDSSAITPPKKTSTDDANGTIGDAKPDDIHPKNFSVGWSVLTPDATHFGYEIIKGGVRFKSGKTPRAERIVVLDGQPQKRFNAIGISTVQFTKDDKHYWYTVVGANGKKSLFVVDGDESKLYDNLTEGQLDETGKAIVFFARKGSRLFQVSAALRD